MANYEMLLEHKEKLRRNRVFLCNNIIPSEDLLGYLLETRTLSEDMYEEIEVEALRKRKVGKLLDILPRRGPDAFKNFIYGLLHSEQTHVAELLDEELAKFYLSQQPTKEPRKFLESVMEKKTNNPFSSGQQGIFHPPQCFDDDDESATYNPCVRQIDRKDPHILALLKDHKNNYKMSSKPRGRAVVVNNSYFVKCDPRDGAAVDSQNICTHLEQLYFEVILKNDLTAEEIKQVFCEESQREDHIEADCFVAFIMSHGSNGYIYGIDGHKVSIEHDIVSHFYGSKCPTLMNKPKVFFIQACQGDQATEGIVGVDVGESQVDAVPINLAQAIKDLSIQDTEATAPQLLRTHDVSDIVLAYSTVPGYRSWRRTDLGSWFIRAIIKVFAAEAYKEDLLSLLVKVRHVVADYHTKHGNHSFIQITRTDETTCKKMFFFPGYYENNRGVRV